MSERILIVGGVAGGATAATKARRTHEHCEIEIFERGGYVSYANCGLPYWLSREIEDQASLLLMNPQKFWDRYRVKVNLATEVVSIDADKQTISVKNNKGEVRQEKYAKLILAQGAMPLKLPIDGADQKHVFFLRSVEDMLAIDNYIQNNKVKNAVIAGGGFIGLEVAEALFHRGLKTSILELMPHVMAIMDQEFGIEFQKRIVEQGLNVYANTGLKAINQKDVLLSNGQNLEAEIVILAAGVRPEIAMAKEAGIELGVSGGILVNSKMETNKANIYAVGDMIELEHGVSKQKTRIPLAGPANRQGRVAGFNAASSFLDKKEKHFKTAYGTSIVRCMGQVAAMVGLNSNSAEKLYPNDVMTTVTYDPHHASYYPGAKHILTRLIWRKSDAKILGAQILGYEGVDRRIDVIATAMAGNLTIEDLEDLDLAYAPPFGSANDPVNIAGFVASNQYRGELNGINADEALKNLSNYFILDIREANEVACGKIKNSLHIPLNDLRDKLNTLDKSQNIITVCQRGHRGYIAERILKQNGFKVHTLLGGFLAAKRAGFDLE